MRIEQRILREFANELDLILVDRPGTRADGKPPRVGRFTPDVWAQSKRRILLGEAKTAADLETAHSNQQLDAFLEHIVYSPPGSRLLLAVPSLMAPRAKIMIAQLARRFTTTTSVWEVIGAEVTL
jgi:hypothetical protein